MKQKIQANIKGYTGKPVSLFGVIDTDTGVLSIVLLSRKQESRRKDCILISNDRHKDHDFAFGDDVLRKAIACYYEQKNSYTDDGATPLLMFSKTVGNCDPTTVIQISGVTESGTDYVLAPTVSNQHIAVMAMCLYVKESIAVHDSLDCISQLDEILTAGYLTI